MQLIALQFLPETEKRGGGEAKNHENCIFKTTFFGLNPLGTLKWMGKFAVYFST